MFRIGFWNTNRKPAAKLISAMVLEQNLNLIAVLEPAEGAAAYLDALNSPQQGRWSSPRGMCQRIALYARFPASKIRARKESRHHTIRTIALPGLPELTLVGVHLKSKLRQVESSQPYSVIRLMEDIRRVETSRNHARTIVLGDFNMDPFEPGMLTASGMHGMATRSTALRNSRIVDGHGFNYFYNPMWSFFGDLSAGPPGTYRYWSSQDVCQEWHIFDQVLLRPDLIGNFVVDQIQIVERIGETPLRTAQGNPRISDHLPVVFELRF